MWNILKTNESCNRAIAIATILSTVIAFLTFIALICYAWITYGQLVETRKATYQMMISNENARIALRDAMPNTPPPTATETKPSARIGKSMTSENPIQEPKESSTSNQATNQNSTKPEPEVLKVPRPTEVHSPQSPENNQISNQTNKTAYDYVLLGVQIVGVAFLIAYTIFAGFQWCAMRKANRIAQDALITQTRPWVNIEEMALQEQLLNEDKKTGTTGVSFNMTYKLQNYGKSPARIMVAQFCLSYSAMFPTTDIKTLRDSAELVAYQKTANDAILDTVFPSMDIYRITSKRFQVSSMYRQPQWLIAYVIYGDGNEKPLRHTFVLYFIGWTKQVDEHEKPQTQMPIFQLYNTETD